MFCTKCGTKNNDGVKFCINCGQKMNSDTATENKYTSNETAQNDTKSTPTKARKSIWKLLLKIVFIVILIPILIGALTLAYQWYQDLPRPVSQLGPIKLGMKPVDVTLSLGKPTEETTDYKGRERYIYKDYSGTTEYLISFDKDQGVSQVCTEDYYNDVFGLGVYDREKNVTDKLGQPTKTSINKEGLVKLISYRQYNVAFGIKEGSVALTCISSSGEVTFAEEYQ